MCSTLCICPSQVLFDPTLPTVCPIQIKSVTGIFYSSSDYISVIKLLFDRGHECLGFFAVLRFKVGQLTRAVLKSIFLLQHIAGFCESFWRRMRRLWRSVTPRVYSAFSLEAWVYIHIYMQSPGLLLYSSSSLLVPHHSEGASIRAASPTLSGFCPLPSSNRPLKLFLTENNNFRLI